MRKLITLLTLIIITLNLTGCYDARGIEDLAYVIAIGIDISDDNELELSLQFAKSDESSSSNSSGSSSQSKETTLTTIKCPTINSGLSLINNHISKKINLSHCQVITISEELSQKGVSEYFDTLFNNVELRSDCSIIVTKCKAKDYLENVKPALESLTARFYKSTLNSAKYTGYTVDITLSEFYSKMKDSCCQTYAILGDYISEENIKEEAKANADFAAGKTPISDKDVIDNLGIAVFRGDKLVGELNGLESICHLIITNDLKECTLSVPNPNNSNKYVDLSLHTKQSPLINVDVSGSTPIVRAKIYLEATGLSMDDSTNYNSEKELSDIGNSVSSYLQNQIQNYLYKTSTEYNSDICGFGKYAIANYTTLDTWYQSNWLDNYKNTKFDISVSTTIKSGEILAKN